MTALDLALDDYLGRLESFERHQFDRLLVRPFMALARFNRNDFIDVGYAAIATLARAGNGLFARAQSGNLRWYGISMIGGLVIVIALFMASGQGVPR